MSTFEVVADLDICQGHQMCQAEAPDVFGFDDAADVVVVKQQHPDESLRQQVESAVVYCPAFALAIAETGPAAGAGKGPGKGPAKSPAKSPVKGAETSKEIEEA